MNKDDVEYEEKITKVAREASQIPKKRVPGWEDVMADPSFAGEGLG